MSWIRRLSLFGGNWKSPILENSIGINDPLWFFSYLFTFYSNLSKICRKTIACAYEQSHLLRCLEIIFNTNFQNQLKKVWNTAIWGQNSHLNFRKISHFCQNWGSCFGPKWPCSRLFSTDSENLYKKWFLNNLTRWFCS